jgi:hypothetical protein
MNVNSFEKVREDPKSGTMMPGYWLYSKGNGAHKRSGIKYVQYSHIVIKGSRFGGGQRPRFLGFRPLAKGVTWPDQLYVIGGTDHGSFHCFKDPRNPVYHFKTIG